MLTRRETLASVGALALAGCGDGSDEARAEGVVRAAPAPLRAVRLKPSVFRDAVEANRRYLLSLDPRRLLHNFHASAGLPVQGETYGGWEARGIAGHTLGHYLSACSLMFAQTGDAAVRERVATIVAELARCQAAHGDGYVGGTTVERDGVVVDGKIVFEEVRRGDIRTGGFDVNGGWVPLYTWHKVHAGLIDACVLGEVDEALAVMLGMAGYLADILERLDDEQMQRLLAAEHGGLNETYAETYALTGDDRWLALAERIRHRAVLDPLTAGRNILPGLHANTQIPKILGLARLYELTGNARHAQTARFFHEVVTRHHSYVIGGNSEREHFLEPDVTAAALTDRTCEACNSYNMLKLTRRLYAWSADARLFDYYERAQINHMLAHQHPETGMFVYFMPMSSGARRTYSTPEDTFWCCVGSGMESHAKHGDSIYWRSGSGETLFVNLFIPSELDWSEAGWRLTLDTEFPRGEEVRIAIADAPAEERTLALRLPSWCGEPSIRLNGAPLAFERADGYALLRRTWRRGDEVALRLPMALTVEPAPDDPQTVAYRHGPMVLAGDLGPAAAPFEGLAPAFVGASPTLAPERVDGASFHYRLSGTEPEGVTLKPFFDQYDRRTAVYFSTVPAAEWDRRVGAWRSARAAAAAVEARTIDVIQLGELESERAHGFRSNHSDRIAAGGRSGRQAWWGVGNYIEADLAVADGPMTLRALYWGEEIDKRFEISVDGVPVATETRPGPPARALVAVEYPLDASLTAGKETVAVRFETRGSDAPVYEWRMVRPNETE